MYRLRPTLAATAFLLPLGHPSLAETYSYELTGANTIRYASAGAPFWQETEHYDSFVAANGSAFEVERGEAWIEITDLLYTKSPLSLSEVAVLHNWPTLNHDPTRFPFTDNLLGKRTQDVAWAENDLHKRAVYVVMPQGNTPPSEFLIEVGSRLFPITTHNLTGDAATHMQGPVWIRVLVMEAASGVPRTETQSTRATEPDGEGLDFDTAEDIANAGWEDTSTGSGGGSQQVQPKYDADGWRTDMNSDQRERAKKEYLKLRSCKNTGWHCDPLMSQDDLIEMETSLGADEYRIFIRNTVSDGIMNAQ